MDVSLLGSIEELEKIPGRASEEFFASRQKIVSKVNLSMEGRSDIRVLTGGSQTSVMRDNHVNHVNTMANVFMLNSFRTLAMTAPWVYRAYISHGFSPDYFPVLFNAFKEAVIEELTPDSAAAIIPVYEWLLEKHKYLLSIQDRADDISGSLDPDLEEERISFRNGLLAGDHKACTKMAAQAVAGTGDFAPFYLGVIQPCMYEIGRMWERGDISVAEEHLASAVAGRVMASLYAEIAATEKTKGFCVVAAVPNEHHELGARMVADLLEQDGWNVRYLGSNIEIESFLSFVRDKEPFFVAISVALPFTIEGAGTIISGLRNDPGTAGVKIMVGGLAFANTPDLWEKLGADGFASNAVEAVKLAEEWRREGDRRTIG